MQVFIAFHPFDPIEVLEKTLEAWAECDGADPCGIQIPKPSAYELYRRVTADQLSEEKHYILADLGCVPSSNDAIRLIQRRLKDDMALVGLNSSDSEVSDIPSGVRVCQKGAVSHWIPKETDDYNKEHAESVKRTGKTVSIFNDIYYKHIGAS